MFFLINSQPGEVIVLSEDINKGDVFKVIYITNKINPLLSKIPSACQFGIPYDFSIFSKDKKEN